MKKSLPGEPWFHHPDMACLNVYPDLFFSTDTRGIEEAKSVCRSCPLVEPCLQQALANGEQGVWGGMSEEERIKLLKKRDPSRAEGPSRRRRRASRSHRVGSAA